MLAFASILCDGIERQASSLFSDTDSRKSYPKWERLLNRANSAGNFGHCKTALSYSAFCSCFAESIFVAVKPKLDR